MPLRHTRIPLTMPVRSDRLSRTRQRRPIPVRLANAIRSDVVKRMGKRVALASDESLQAGVQQVGTGAAAGRWPTIILLGLLMPPRSALAAAPSFSMFGAFFPAWLAFGLFGIAIALLCRVGFVLAGLDQTLHLRLFAYLGVAVTAGGLGWLVAYGPMP